MVAEKPFHEPPHNPNLPTQSSERWLPVAGYEGLYEVSDYGRVRRIDGRTKLSLQDIERAKQMRAAGIGYHRIAKHFGISKMAMRKTLNYQYKRAALRQPNRLLSLLNSTHGYKQVNLCKDGVPTLHSVHALVARAFIGVRQSKWQVNHKNGEKTDNRLDNLEYVTQAQNTKHAVDVLGWKPAWAGGEKNGMAKLTADQVREIRRLHAAGASQVEIGRMFAVTNHAVHKIVKRVNWRHV